MEKIDSYKTLLTFVNGFANKETAEESPFIFAIKGPDNIGIQTCVKGNTLFELYRGITDTFIESLKNSGASKMQVTQLMAMICAEMTAKNYPLKGKLDDISDETVDKLSELLDGLKEALGMEGEDNG